MGLDGPESGQRDMKASLSLSLPLTHTHSNLSPSPTHVVHLHDQGPARLQVARVPEAHPLHVRLPIGVEIVTRCDVERGGGEFY
jgi:hypothetical protein